MKRALNRIGPYEVLGVVGEGGMGRVYRARDQRLGRQVAVKVLPEDLRNDSGRLRRFQREARAIGKLSHPNILTVYDVGEDGGAPYLVTELLEGETLRERLERGPLPPAEAIDMATQVARGLMVAHDSGIVHRDLKPSNLFVCEDGYIKILDFGIAKQQESGDVARTETAVTREGTPIGSVGYMPPEQIRGRPVDARSDVFALGIVLFEMIAGTRPFGGDTDVEVAIATLQEREPSLGDSALDAIIARCLAKSPDDRYASARDLAAELEALAADLPAAIEVRVTPARAIERPTERGRWWIAAAAAAVAVAGAGGGAWMMQDRDAAPAASTAPRAEIRETMTTRLPDPVWRHAVSHDGKTTAYNQGAKVFVRATDGGQSTPLPAPEDWGPTFPIDFFPDGRRLMVVFMENPNEPGASAAFAIVDLDDGSARVVYRGRDIGWSARLAPDGSVLAFTAPDGIHTITADGEGDRVVVPQRPGETSPVALTWAPDGSHLAYIRGRHTGKSTEHELLVTAADGTRTETLPVDGLNQESGGVFGAEWFDEHRIVYGHAGTEGATSELWQIGMRGGAWDGQPARRVFRFASGFVDHFRRGGDRLFLIKNEIDPNIYQAQLGPDGESISEPRLVERFYAGDNARDVTAGGDVLFDSGRNGSSDIFRRSPDGTVTLVAGTPGFELWPSAAGDAVLYWLVTGEKNSLYRAEPGEQPKLLGDFPPGDLPRIHCAAKAPERCIATVSDSGDWVTRLLDPRTGALGDEIYRRPLANDTGRVRLDADGARGVVPIARRDRPTLALIDLADRTVRELVLDAPRVGLMNVSWMMDGRFALTAMTPGVPYWLGIADETGKTRELWRTENGLHTPPLPFPDGRTIALTVVELKIQQWAIDGL